MTFLKILLTIALTLLIFGVQKYCSTRADWRLGGIVPLLSIAVLAALFVQKGVALSAASLTPCLLLLLLEGLIWFDGRRQRRKEELLRMKIQDLQ